jgi:transglutaminase-like putative cysteine protease
MGSGDCDDHSIVIAALAKVQAYPVRFRVASTNGKTWTHVYAVIGVPKRAPTRWIAMDSTDPFVGAAGWDPAERYRLRNRVTGETHSIPYVDFVV